MENTNRLFVDQLVINDGKTKGAIASLKGLAGVKGFELLFKKRNNSAAIALGIKNEKVEKAFRNLGQVEVFEARNLDPLTLLKYKYLVVENPDVAIKAFPKLAKDRKPASTRGDSSTRGGVTKN